MGVVRRALLVLALLLVGAQAFRIDRDNPPVVRDVDAPPPVHELLRRACYDCHSNETQWPWYSAVAPVSWLLAHDVDEGRGELNFSTWDAYPAAKKAKKLKETADEVAEGEMPPWYYVMMHAPARLSEADRAALAAWTAAERTRLEH
jgi:hypothetical protein